MIVLLKSNRFLLFFLVLLICSLSDASGQNNSVYTGELDVGPYSGQAEYGYTLINSDTILNGTFEFQRSSLSALIAKEDVSFLFKGAFKNDYPTGPWRFQFGEFQSNSNSQVVDYQYRVLVSGIQETANGVIENGKPDGRWLYEVNGIQDSEVQDTLFRSSLEFDKGVPLRSFTIKNDKSTLVGRFLRDGSAHDEWVLYGSEGTESLQTWYFKSGRLEKIEVEEEGVNTTLNVYKNTGQRFKTITLDQRFLSILELWIKPSDSTLLKKGIPALLSKNAGYYQKLDSILSQLGKSSFEPQLMVKVPIFSIDSTATANLDAAHNLYKEARSISDALLKDTQLNILKLSDDKALSYYTALQNISKKFLRPLGTILSYHKNDILRHIPFERTILEVWPKGFPSKEIRMSADTLGTQTFLGPKAAGFDFTENNSGTVLQMADYAASSVDSIVKILHPKLENVKRSIEFTVLEKQMIARIDNLNMVKDSVEKKLPSDLVKVLDQIKSVADKGLSTYSNTEDLDVKLDYGRNLIVCFEQLGNLKTVILNLPANKEEIKTIYGDKVWNPFMANLMTEDVKKRIVNAYRKVLLPHLIERASNDLSCGNAQLLVTHFNGVHERMLELREADTKKLERKLKRKDDPNEVMQLFQIEPLGKTEE